MCDLLCEMNINISILSQQKILYTNKKRMATKTHEKTKRKRGGGELK